MGIELIDRLEPREGALRLKMEGNRAPDRQGSVDAGWENIKPEEGNRWRGCKQGVQMRLILQEHVFMFEMVARMTDTGNRHVGGAS